MSQIDATDDPYNLQSKYSEIHVLAKSNINRQFSLQKENVPYEMDSEQTWPTTEEIAASYDKNKKPRLIKRIPRGMSEYQAAWISETEEVDEYSSESEGREGDDEFMSCDDDGESVNERKHFVSEVEKSDPNFEIESLNIENPANDDSYDKAMDLDEEKKTLEKIKAAHEEKHYSDEIDTPQDIALRSRFAKYRGLESFRTSPWDIKENLPYDYARIFKFKNFDRTRKRVLKEAKTEMFPDLVLPGLYVTIHVKNVDHQMWHSFESAKKHLILYGLLPHEHQMSVVNVVLKRVVGSVIPLKAKERLIVQCGFRRFIVNPIFSQHTNGDKHKYERFFRPQETVVATFFAPIQFPPAPVLCFLQNPNTTLSLVATGRLISCDPDRIILKRIVLSGHPFKIHRQTATIRYMFFNKEDIEYFKLCKLRTKCGRLGHIKESLGTHGHMKCVFDGSLKSFDTVFLHLYKRVYPKWTHEDCLL